MSTVTTMLLRLLTLLQGPLFTRAFNMDTETPAIYPGDPKEEFGYQVVIGRSQNQPWLMVSAPRATDRAGNGTGALYLCKQPGSHCQPVPVPNTENISLGLSLRSKGTAGSKIIACGPTLMHWCERNPFLSGVCYVFQSPTEAPKELRPPQPECVSGVDAVILCDDSSSINTEDFRRAKTFISSLIKAVQGANIQFSVVQFATTNDVVFDFKRYQQTKGNIDNDLYNFPHIGGQTHTPSAILFATKNIFTPERGARPHTKKLLIILTDGQSNDLKVTFEDANKAADEAGLLRLAIGVGQAFNNPIAQEELKVIASPGEGKVFQVGDFGALASIQKQLQERIFSIEGSEQTTNASSLQKELSQAGISSLLTADSVVLGAPGAYDWAGGLELLDTNASWTFYNISVAQNGTRDAYLGYALAEARRGGGVFLVGGAPRHEYVGRVSVFLHKEASGELRHLEDGEQVGSYFGAELCSVDLDRDGDTDLLLIAAPLYHGPRIGGLVSICSLSDQGRLSCGTRLRGVAGNVLGHFGAALASLGDVDGDGVGDVAVGAPMEDEGQGAVYLFLGEGRGLRAQHSQRITAAALSPGLRALGQTLHGGVDVSGDGLPDLGVGARGHAVLLRSRPVFVVGVSLSVQPTRLPPDGPNCHISSPRANLTICFMTNRTTPSGSLGGEGALLLPISYSLYLDVGKDQSRLLVPSRERGLVSSLALSPGTECVMHVLLTPHCLADTLSPVLLSVNFSMVRDPETRAQGLAPVLHPRSNTTTLEQVLIDHACGEDEICTADLTVRFNFSGASSLQLASEAELHLTVQLTNVRETALRPSLHIASPSILSFSRVTILQAGQPLSLSCEGPGEWTNCTLTPPALWGGTKALLLFSFRVMPDLSWLGGAAQIIVTAHSDNEEPQTLEDNRAVRTIPVLRPVGIVIMGGDSTPYLNFTAEAPENRLLTHSYQVQSLGPSVVQVIVTLKFPLVLESGFQWKGVLGPMDPAVTCQTFNGSKQHERDESSEKQPMDKLGCRGASICSWIQCKIPSMAANDRVTFSFSGDLLPQEPGLMLKAGLLTLQSEAAVQIDETKYFQTQAELFSHSQVNTDLELLASPRMGLVIAASTIGGLLVLGIIAGALYKFGFFQRSQHQMADEVSNSPESPVVQDPGAPQPTAPEESVNPEGAGMEG